MNATSSPPQRTPTRPTAMNAWTTRGDGIEKLCRKLVPIPVPGAGQVLVKMAAWSLNYRDLLVIGGVDGWKPPSDVVPVSDGVGVVVEAGPPRGTRSGGAPECNEGIPS